MVHGPGGSLGAPALYNVEEERKPGTEIALTHDLPMVVETALEDLVKSVHVIHSHAQVNDSSKTCRTWFLVMRQKETSLTEFVLNLTWCAKKIFFKTSSGNGNEQPSIESCDVGAFFLFSTDFPHFDYWVLTWVWEEFRKPNVCELSLKLSH